MEAGGSQSVPRLRRSLQRGPEPRDPLPQPPLRGGGTAEESTAVEKKRKPLTRLNIHSAFWILASISVTYYFDFLKTVKETIQADSWWFASGSCLFAACLSVASYCILYLEWYCGIEDYDARYPALIPITTATFIAAAVCCIGIMSVSICCNAGRLKEFQHCLVACLVVYDTFVALHSVHGFCDACVTPGITPSDSCEGLQ